MLTNKIFKILIFFTVVCLAAVPSVFSAPDFYAGDSAVYMGEGTSVRPNIMFLIDNSGAMKDIGSQEPYDPSIDYATLLDLSSSDAYESGRVYLRNVANENNTNYQTTKFTVDEVGCSRLTDQSGNYAEEAYDGSYATDFPNGDGYDDGTNEIHPRYALEQNGFWYGALDSKGSCPNNQNQWENYFSGNFLNYLQNTSETITWAEWKSAGDADGSYQLGAIVEPTDYDMLFKCIEVTGSPGSSEPDWNPQNLETGPVPGTIVNDGGVVWEALGTVMDMVQYQMEHVVFQQVRNRANMGIMTFGDNNHGAKVVEPVLKAGLYDAEGAVNYQKLIGGLVTLEDLVNGNTQPVNESLWDAYLYWKGESDSSDGISSDKAAYPTPIEHWCQGNHLVVLTTGSAGNNSQTKTKVGDVDGDGNQGLVDDVAKLMHDNLGLTISGFQPQVRTHVIQLMTPYVQRLEMATDENHGNGKYYNIKNPQELINALIEIIGGILEESSSFVAPVVPASPDNRGYSGERIYLGFFKPMNDEPWYGNLKKFNLGLNSDSRIKGFDADGNEINATYRYPEDTNDPRLDGQFLVQNDDFELGIPDVASHWNSGLDGGEVNMGGVGGKLMARNFTINPRKIYTRLTSDNLTDAGNRLAKSNANLTAGILNVTADARDNVIDFVHGYDAYDEYAPRDDGKRPWILGDIIHSKPVVLNYKKYDPETDDETSTVDNQGYIFVGSNSGMLHAFRDATGEEAWSFVPKDLLKNLQFLPDTTQHIYFVDNSPVIYVFDKDGADGIDASSGDMAILICGMRRGGGTSTLTQAVEGDPPPSRGSYFALDISNPESPQFLWTINSETSDAGELSQTWSLPYLTKMRIGSSTKVVAVTGAGYDTNEDLRYGNTQDFPDGTDDETVTSLAPNGAGNITSPGSSGPYSARGRGIFVIEVADLSAEDPLTNSGSVLWHYSNNDMVYSFPGDPLVVDRDSDGYSDHIYTLDTGGQLWRFNVESDSISDWTGTLVFQANIENSGDVGRKAFYKPTATVNGLDTFIYFGTGDREHPLNAAVVDRFYVVRDRQSGTSSWDYSLAPLTEDQLVDVTEDQLQDSTVNQNVKDTLRQKLTYPYTVGEQTYYGWYLQLDEHAGEKVLALPKVVNNVVFFTTYTPAIVNPDDPDFDPCAAVLGPSRMYAVKAQTAEAVFDFYKPNNSESDGETVAVLERRDRYMEIGEGIASEPLVVVTKTGSLSTIVGRGGGFFSTPELDVMDPVFQVYWMKW
jgi:type IV pilus assembly protein PilY1